ncbi:MAG: response regulator transcription factor [Hyphomicrobiaceae bacterium]
MTERKRILLVDDEPQIHRFLKPSLIVSGYDVTSAADGRQALRAVAAEALDAVLLDLGLPDVDGKEVITGIRRMSDVPVIVLSARDRESEKIAALDLGADDYVNKPFSIGEMLARLRSVLRRRPVQGLDEPEVHALGDIKIDSGSHRVTRGGQVVHLTPKEFELLALLARHADRVLTHRQILEKIWGPAHTNDTQYLRVYIGQLRQKLEADPAEPRIILTEPGIGYRVIGGE